MIAWKFKLWRAAGAAAVLGLAACGGEGGETGETGHSEQGEAGESGDAAAPAPTSSEGGESGEAGAASAYAGLSGDAVAALRLQHLKGFVMAAERVVESGTPADAGVLVQQGLLEVYDGASDQFGSLDVAIVRSAGDAGALSRAEETARLRAAEAEIQRASAALDADPAVITARMVDIATGLYQGVIQADFVDSIEYQHSMGAALAARDELTRGRSALQHRNGRAYTEAQAEIERFVGLWAQTTAPEQPTPYAQVLAQGSRVRLALSPYL